MSKPGGEGSIERRIRRLEGQSTEPLQCAESWAAWERRLPADDALRVQAAEELREWEGGHGIQG